jgi:hypothetical protein
MKHLLYLLCACLLTAPACSSKKDDPAAATPAAIAPPTITVSVDGAAGVKLATTSVIAFSLGGAGDMTALYSMQLYGALPNSQGIFLHYEPSITQPATKVSAPLYKITLAKSGQLIESGSVTGTASNNATTKTAAGTFSGTLSDGTKISGTFEGASTKQ